MDVFSHRLLITQCHVFRPLFLFVQRVIDDLLGGVALELELVLLDVHVRAHPQRLHGHVDVLEFQLGHVF